MAAPTTKVGQEVLRHANKLHGMVSAAGNETAVQRLEAEAKRWSEAGTDAVFAGDVKRGKSSLINAVIGRYGLLPVDADVATAVHLAVHDGTPEAVRVTRVDHETGATTVEEIDPARLADFASMSGDQEVVATVTAAEVVVQDPLLARGLTLVDTPGVGGMTRGHRDITMAALQRADVLVFVVSCSEPVSLTELEFLSEASERIGNVVLVATRADLGTGDTNDAMAEDVRRRIGVLADRRETDDPAAARRLRRLAERPVVLTSSYLAEQAARRLERGRVEQAAAMRAESGIDELIGRLGQAVDARENVRLANLLQLVSVITNQMESEQSDRLRAVDGDGSVEEELRARSEELERAVGAQARWRGVLANGISRMQTGAGRDVSRELTAVRDHYRELFDSKDVELDIDAFSVQLQQSLVAAWANLSNQVSTQFDGVINSLMEELTLEAEPGLLGEFEMPPGIQDMTNRRDLTNDFDLLDDALPLATQAFSFGNIANALVGVLGIATGGLGLAAYGIGAALSGSIVMLRRKKREQRQQAVEMQRALNEALFGQEGIVREFTTELTLRIIDARQSLEVMIEDRLTARRKELETQRRELQELLRSEMATRTSTRAEVERRLGELKSFRNDTDRLVAEVDRLLEQAFAGTPTPSSTSEPVADEPVPAEPVAATDEAPQAPAPAGAAVGSTATTE
ncbi:MAG: dynamin family protein [Acidimicrobiales bacterium]|nr:dynamin family protein [Acidimicrobiales bacterium]